MIPLNCNNTAVGPENAAPLGVRLTTRRGLDSLRRGSGAHGRNGRDPAVDQEVCPDDVRRIVRREVNCQLRDSNGSAIRLLGLLVPRTPLTASPCSAPGKRPNIAVSVGPGLRVFTRIPRSTSSALRIRARWTTAALEVETVEVVGHPLRAPTDALMITDEPCLSSGKAF